MKLIIDIPEDVYKRTVFYREFRDLNDCVTTIKALENSISLPKGHGDLIDRNSILCDDCSCEQCGHTDECFKLLTPTIIEADNGE